jgi:hypothetical protein
MGALLSGFAVALTCSAVLAAGQDKAPKPKTPSKGDNVIVRGCVRGSVIESTETRLADDTGSAETALTYQLKGEKATLKTIRDTQQDQVVELTGVLKSEISEPVVRGKQIGKTRIFIGGSTPPDRGEISQHEQHPVLEVKSFKPTDIRCRL